MSRVVNDFIATVTESPILMNFIDSLSEGVLIMDSEQRIMHVNKRFSKILGYTLEEIQGSHLDRLLPDTIMDRHVNLVNHFFSTPTSRSMAIGLPLQGKHKDGSMIELEIGLSFFVLPEKTYACALITDATLPRTQKKIILEKNQHLEAFAHTLAHDIKGSLTPILGYGELLQSLWDGKDQMILQESLNGIIEGSKKALSIIDELLRFALLQDDIIMQPVDHMTIITASLARADELIKSTNANVEIMEEFPIITSHAPWIEEVWYNFITNAVKYGGRPSVIKIGWHEQKNEHYCFWVEDNGMGISEEDQEKLFHSRTRLDKTSIEGTGIGLLIVRKIIQRLGGQVGVSSFPGNGSRFWFSLPRIMDNR